MDDNIDNETPQTPDIWSLMTWLASAILAYLILSGALIFWLEFGVYAQYSVIVHTVIGLVAIGPVSWLVWKHWRRRDGTVSGAPALLARLSIPALVLCLASGVVISLQAAFGTSVSALAWLTHQLLALIFAESHPEAPRTPSLPAIFGFRPDLTAGGNALAVRRRRANDSLPGNPRSLCRSVRKG